MRFFFYGTLIAGAGNPVAGHIHARMRELGPAVARGWLHAIPTAQGWYPAFIAEPRGEPVYGWLYETLPGFAAQDLALLDAYEACYPDRPDESEYLRKRVDVLCDGHMGPAEAYIYRARPPRDALAVPCGDFFAFLDDGGLPPYRVPPEEIGSTFARLRRD
jgi:gamma-glutamylcyclotransferase (GGCT)/AIG2-like uncharacterized protein YtfP